MAPPGPKADALPKVMGMKRPAWLGQLDDTATAANARPEAPDLGAQELAARIGIDQRTSHDKSEGNAPWRRALRET